MIPTSSSSFPLLQKSTLHLIFCVLLVAYFPLPVSHFFTTFGEWACIKSSCFKVLSYIAWGLRQLPHHPHPPQRHHSVLQWRELEMRRIPSDCHTLLYIIIKSHSAAAAVKSFALLLVSVRLLDELNLPLGYIKLRAYVGRLNLSFKVIYWFYKHAIGHALGLQDEWLLTPRSHHDTVASNKSHGQTRLTCLFVEATAIRTKTNTITIKRPQPKGIRVAPAT